MSLDRRVTTELQVLLAAHNTSDRISLQKALEEMGFQVSSAHDINTAIQLAASNRFSLSIIVHHPEHLDALQFLKESRKELKDSGHKSIILSEVPDIEAATTAMKLGAMDFRCRPWDENLIEMLIIKAMEELNIGMESLSTPGKQIDLDAGKDRESSSREDNSNEAPPSNRNSQKNDKKCPAENKPAGTEMGQEHDRYRILYQSPVMEAVLKKARMVAPSQAPVLISGESGTGKELLARFIHARSSRASGPFIALNCAALPDTLLESELFGHEKGAFSGALSRKSGKFELANGGTILLDEITEMAFPLQAKLLRVLQEGEIDRLGGGMPVPVDVRILATTNRDMLSAVKDGLFREDLYFRLNVIPLLLPPLREREGDALFLAEHFLKKFSLLYNKTGLEFAKEVIEYIQQHRWPGNVRELRNLVERGVLLSSGKKITLEDIQAIEDSTWEKNSHSGQLFGQEQHPGNDNHPWSGTRAAQIAETHETFNLNEMEKQMVQKALSRTGGNRTHAAKLLGISVRTLRNKLAEYRKTGLVL